MSDDKVFKQFKHVLENNKTFMGSEFLSLYCRVLFGQKPDKDTQKLASLVCKEFKSFTEKALKKEKDLKIDITNLSNLEQNILESVNQIVSYENKIFDGDIMLSSFKKVIDKNNNFNAPEAKKLIEKFIRQEILSVDIIDSIESALIERKKIFEVITHHSKLESFLSNGYKNINDLDGYKDKLSNLVMSSAIDLSTARLERIGTSYMSEESAEDFFNRQKGKFRIPTRYELFDYIFTGGLENGRVYIFGGISGGGKSLFLINLVYSCKIAIDEMKIPKDEKWGILYLTLENSTEQTQMRFMCCSLGVSLHQMNSSIQNIENVSLLSSQYNEIFKKCPTETCIVWKAPLSINAIDVMSTINEIERTKGIKIKMCAIDYADKMKSIADVGSDVEWIKLGSIIDELKSLAVEKDIPVVTVTQLNKSGYDEGGPKSTSVAGSMRKRENADVLILFDFAARQEVYLEDSKAIEEFMDKNTKVGNFIQITGTVDKNRDGPSGIKFPCYIDYPSYRFIDSRDRCKFLFKGIDNSLPGGKVFL